MSDYYIEGPRPLLEAWQGERDAMPYHAVSCPAGTMVREITGGAGEAWVYLIAEIDGVEVSLRGRSDPVLRDPSREPREPRDGTCGAACDARYHELRTILGAGQTETIADAARRAIRRADVAELGLDHALTAGEQGLVAELDAARAEVVALTQALEAAQARIDELTARAEKGGAS